MYLNVFLKFICTSILLGLIFQGQSQIFQFDHYNEHDGLDNLFIYDIKQSDQGEIWCASGNGIYTFNGKQWRQILSNETYSTTVFRRLFFKDDLTFAINEEGKIIQIKNDKPRVFAVTRTQSRPLNLWFSNDVIHVIQQNGSYTRFDLTGTLIDEKQFGEGIEKCFFIDGYIVLYKNDQILLNDQKTTSFHKITDPNLYTKIPTLAFLNKPEGLNSFVVNEEIVLAATNEGLIMHPDRKEDNTYVISSNNGLETDLVYSVFIDDENTIWLGTFGSGIYALPAYSFRKYPIREGISNLIEHDKKLYAISTDSLYIYSYFGGQHLPQISTDSIYAIDKPITLASINNELYIFTAGKGVYKFNQDNLSIEAFSTSELFVYVNSIFTYNDKIYACTPYHGVIVCDNNFNVLKQYNTSNGLPHNDINNVIVNDSSIWFLSNSNGVYKLTENNWQTFSEEDGLVTSSAQQGISVDNKTLIATEGAGCVLFDNNNISYLYSELKGLPKYVYGLAETDEFIILSSAGSVLLLNKLLNRIENDLSVKSNLVHSEIAVINDKTLVISSTEGLIFLDLPVTLKSPKAQININVFEAKGITYDTDKPIELRYGEYNIRINLNAVSPNHAQSMLYSYKLEGYDDEWSAPQMLEEIKYQKLTEGEYKLRIKPILPYGETSFEEKIVEFRIKTPFWKTTTFIVSIIILTLGIIILITEIRNRSIKRYSKTLQKLVKSRTRQLEAQNTRLEEYTYAISHDLKNPVINIKGLAEILSEEEVGDEEKQEMINLLESSSDQLYNNLLGLIEAIKAGQLKQDNTEHVNLQDLIHEIETSVSLDIKSSNAIIGKKLHENIVLFDKENLRSVLYNIFSNALKYRDTSRQLKIIFGSNLVDDGIVINISDNGLGMDMEKDGANLFGMFKRVHNHVEGSGIGMYLVNSIIERAGGKIDVESTPGKGTTFHIFIPQQKNLTLNKL